MHGFDSFERLPEDWSGQYCKGAFDMRGSMPAVRSNVVLPRAGSTRPFPSSNAAKGRPRSHSCTSTAIYTRRPGRSSTHSGIASWPAARFCSMSTSITRAGVTTSSRRSRNSSPDWVSITSLSATTVGNVMSWSAFRPIWLQHRRNGVVPWAGTAVHSGTSGRHNGREPAVGHAFEHK